MDTHKEEKKVSSVSLEAHTHTHTLGCNEFSHIHTYLCIRFSLMQYTYILHIHTYAYLDYRYFNVLLGIIIVTRPSVTSCTSAKEGKHSAMLAWQG